VTDGFGRPIATGDSVGLKTRTDYDACGRIIFESLPYTEEAQGEHGTTFTYDALGRVRTVTAPGNRTTTYTYSGSSVTSTDPGNRTTVFTYIGFGGPGERLLSVQDAAGVTTSYEYSTTGLLTKVTGPGPIPPRQWVVAGARVLSETHPESGRTTYDDYWNNGLLKQRTDALGQVTTFTYNGDGQLEVQDAPGTADDVTLTYEVGPCRSRGSPRRFITTCTAVLKNAETR
jgi:YD repeat-containing protein